MKTIISRIDRRIKAITPPGAKLLSDRKVSLLCGDNPDLIRNIRRQFESGKQTNVNASTLERLEIGLKTTASWLLREEGPEIADDGDQLFGEGSINQPRRNASHNVRLTENRLGTGADLDLDDLITVPEMDVYGGGSRSGGFGQEENTTDGRGNTFSTDVVRANWGIPAPFLRSELNTSPGKAHIVPVRGDSMNDALFAGDRAIINLDDVDVGQDGIFALLDDSASLIIKQVEVVRGSRATRIVCTSRNPSYKPFELELTDPVRIIGRVVGKITRL